MFLLVWKGYVLDKAIQKLLVLLFSEAEQILETFYKNYLVVKTPTLEKTKIIEYRYIYTNKKWNQTLEKSFYRNTHGLLCKQEVCIIIYILKNYKV